MSNQKLFSLKLKIAQLTACSKSLFRICNNQRSYIEKECVLAKERNSSKRFHSILSFWVVVAGLLFVKSITGMGETLYYTLYFVNYITFLGCLVGNIIKHFKLQNKYDDEISDTLFGMMRISATMMAFQSSLEKSYEKHFDKLSDEEKEEYKKYEIDHEKEITRVLESQYNVDEIYNIISEMASENDNNQRDDYTDYQEYENTTMEYLEHVNSLMVDYLLEEQVDNLSDDDKKLLEMKI